MRQPTGTSALIGPLPRVPYRLGSDRLHIFDQRRLPEAVSEQQCQTADQVAYAIHAGVVRSPIVARQLSLYALWLTALNSTDEPAGLAENELVRAASVLNSAAPAVARVGEIIRQTLGAIDRPASPASARRIRRLANYARHEDFQACRDVVQRAQIRLSNLKSPRSVLVLGYHGRLATGNTGTVTGVVAGMAARDPETSVWVLESRPGLEGARLSATELLECCTQVYVVADSTGGQLIRSERISAVILGADWVATNGDIAATGGSYAVASMARDCEIPVVACALSSSLATEVAEGDVLDELFVADDLAAYGRVSYPTQAPTLSYLYEIVPARLITDLIVGMGRSNSPRALERQRRSAS